MLKQVLIRLVLGKSGRYSELTMLRGKKYIVVIQPYGNSRRDDEKKPQTMACLWLDLITRVIL